MPGNNNPKGVSPSEVFEYLNELAVAQNRCGVTVMTCLQMLIEKGLLDGDEVQARFDKNLGVTLDEEGGCVIPLRTLLNKGGGDGDDHGGSKTESS
jgi:hypothetical protein